MKRLLTNPSQAISCTKKFIENSVIFNMRPELMLSLHETYVAEYVGERGDKDDITSYSRQNLQRKLVEKYGEKLRAVLFDQRKGNIICSSVFTEEDVRIRLNDNVDQYKEDKKIRWAALHLRSQILQLPKSKTADPPSIQNLKECASAIPRQLALFVRWFLNGLKEDDYSNEAVNRKVTAIASDAIFNVTGGALRGRKHTVMGLGFASLAGSKLAPQILKRESHSIDYCAVKGLKTEFAYGIRSYESYAPDGIRLDPSLATACLWENHDAIVETLDGKGSLHQ